MSDELEPGTMLAGRYRIDRALGTGAMGEVYAGYHEALERPIAVKVIRQGRRGNELSKNRFMREAKVAARLRHPGAVDIYDFGEDDGLLYLVMEKLTGPPLRTFVDEGLQLLPLERVVAYGVELAEVLAAAAKIGVVHRDLKPENVMFHDDGSGSRLVIVDFGLAHDLDESGTTSRMTREGVITGTPDYLSPEQARGERCTPASDVYSLGCVLYEMLTGAPPFGQAPTPVLLARHIYTKPPSLRESAPELGIPSPLDDLVSRMLAKEPTERPSALAVAESLRALDLNAPQRFSGRSGFDDRSARSQRMVSTRATANLEAPDAPKLSADAPAEERCVAWRGYATDDLVTALAVGGIEVVDEGAPAGVLVIPAAEPEEVARLTAEGVTVLTDADPSDLGRVQSLIQAGVAEVLTLGKGPEDWARTIARALRKRRRRKPR